MLRQVLSLIAIWIAVLLASTAIHPVNIYVAIATAPNGEAPVQAIFLDV